MLTQARQKYKTNYYLDFQKTKPIRKKKDNEGGYVPQHLALRTPLDSTFYQDNLYDSFHWALNNQLVYEGLYNRIITPLNNEESDTNRM